MEGNSSATVVGSIWEAVTYLPGVAIGWSRQPTLRDVGRLLAEFHAAAGAIAPSGQRPLCTPVETVGGLVAPAGETLDSETQRFLSTSADDLARDLDAIGHRDTRAVVIHGDFTAHNVVAAGRPRAPVGIIDFANTYLEAPLADISFGLWRSGRTAQTADSFDPQRIASLVGGYSSVRPLDPGHAATIVVYLKARGMQIIVKSAKRGIVDHGPIARLGWLAANGPRLQDSIERALA